MDAAETRAGHSHRPARDDTAKVANRSMARTLDADQEERRKDSMRYEIEQAGTHAEPECWRVVNIVDAEVVPVPLAFDTLQPALAYVARTHGPLRVVEVTDDGERLPVDA